MTEHVVRRANEGDLSDLAQLYAAWNDEEDGKPADAGPEFEQRFRTWYAEESSRRVIWLAEVAGRPVGFADLAIAVRPPTPRRTAVRRGYLDTAFVLEPYRDQGVGTTLLNALLDHARRRGIARILLYPTTKAVPFYQRAGFDLLPADPKIRMVTSTLGTRAPDPTNGLRPERTPS